MTGASAPDPERVAFLQGLLVAFASAGQVVDFEELRKLCRCESAEFIAALEAARAPLRALGQPDYCAVVLSESGLPAGFRDLEAWEEELARVHLYWADVRRLSPEEFRELHGSVPAVPRSGS